MRERGYTQGTHFLTGCFYTPIPSGSDGDESSCNAGDPGSISRSWWSPGEGNGNLLQYFCLGNPMDRGAWRAIVHRVTKSRTWLKRRTHTQNALRYLISMKNNPWTTRLYVFKSFVFFLITITFPRESHTHCCLQSHWATTWLWQDTHLAQETSETPHGHQDEAETFQLALQCSLWSRPNFSILFAHEIYALARLTCFSKHALQFLLAM